jgi:hypothetical protein
MVAYSFKNQFVEPIVKGTKTQTVRGNGKRRHARVGESLQLYYAMRTKQCTKIVADPICTLVLPVAIDIEVDCQTLIEVNGKHTDFEAFARNDGFASLAELTAFWLQTYGVGRFEGTLIGWEAAS